MKRATKKHSKTQRNTTKQRSAVTTAPSEKQLVKLGRLALKLHDARKVGVMPIKAKPKTLTLTEGQKKLLRQEAASLGQMFNAVGRLAWMTESNDREEQNAATVALEAISELGAFRADYIIGALGEFGVGGYDDNLKRYAEAAGYVRKGADHA